MPRVPQPGFLVYVLDPMRCIPVCSPFPFSHFLDFICVARSPFLSVSRVLRDQHFPDSIIRAQAGKSAAELSFTAELNFTFQCTPLRVGYILGRFLLVCVCGFFLQ
jgi:hypothetical protein